MKTATVAFTKKVLEGKFILKKHEKKCFFMQYGGTSNSGRLCLQPVPLEK